MIRQRFRLLILYLTFILAILGFVAFLAGVVIEFFSRGAPPTDRLSGELSPVIQVALAGLCTATLMSIVWFGVVGWLLARQTRQLGAEYGDAYRLIEAFRFHEAIPLLERIIREGKETSEVLMLLTSAYAYNGQLAKAQATADRAVQLFPNDPSAYVTLANGYRLQAAYDEAARALMQAAALAPEQPITWAELGFVQRFAGDHVAAVESFKTAAHFPMPEMYALRVYYHLAQAYKTSGESDEAVRAAQRMMSARNGINVWKTGLNALEGTAYGQALRYEIAAIEQALADADAGSRK
ncbi:MAG: tetratricopeptide repeat protein [Anaerolineae bacterium]